MKLFYAGYLTMYVSGMLAFGLTIANDGYAEGWFVAPLTVTCLIGVGMMIAWGIRVHNTRRRQHFKNLDYLANSQDWPTSN